MSMITVERLLALRPCYSEVQLRTLVGGGVRPGSALKLLLALPRSDARWVLSRLLDRQQRVRWAQMAAARARGYANAAANAAANYAASAAANYAANVAANAADGGEHRMACVIGLELLVEQENGT
jgi:hypothetical protein